MIRTATLDDAEQIARIETAAGEAFRAIGMREIADDPPPGREQLAGVLDLGAAWVYVEHDRAVAYLFALVVGGSAHIEQVTVHPDAARRGIGAELIAHADAWSRERGLDGLTLTTFADVPWNAPYYARLGFTVIANGDRSEALAEHMALEAEHGLERWPRVAMRR